MRMYLAKRARPTGQAAYLLLKRTAASSMLTLTLLSMVMKANVTLAGLSGLDETLAAAWHMEGLVCTYDEYGNPRPAIDDDDSEVPGRDHLLILGNRTNPYDPATFPSIVSGGVSGNALRFDGLDDIAYSEDAWEDQDDVVLDFYINPASFSSDAELVTVTNAFSIRLQIDGQIHADVYEQGTGTVYPVLSHEIVHLNEWNHVVLQIINGTVSLYVNGGPGTVNTFSGDIQTSSSPEIYIGSTSTGARPFMGDMDEIRIRQVDYSGIVIQPITQGHPRLLINATDVVGIQSDINNMVEPRYSAWLHLIEVADIGLTNAIDAPYTGDLAIDFYYQARKAGRQSSRMALAYLLGGDTAYAARAKEILLTWARATPGPATAFDPVKWFPGEGMVTARGIVWLLYTYDYIYNYPDFTAAEKADVEAWFRAVLPSIQNGIDRWDAQFKLDTTDPRGYSESTSPDDRYFQRQYYQNHLVAHTMGYLQIGYVLGDRDLVQFAVDSPDNPRDFLELLTGTIMMDGDPEFCFLDQDDPRHSVTNPPPPQNGEIYDRYRAIEYKGLGYAMLTLCEMMSMEETLFANGVDINIRRGPYGETMEYPFHFYADFFRLNDTSIKGGYYQYEAAGVPLWLMGIFEVANRRYPGNREIEDLLHSVDRTQIDPTGILESYFCFPVLTHGAPLTGGVVALNAEITEEVYKLEWPTAIGNTYTLFRTTDLMTEDAWEPLAITNSTGGMMEFTDFQGSRSNRVFYRLSIEQ